MKVVNYSTINVNKLTDEGLKEVLQHHGSWTGSLMCWGICSCMAVYNQLELYMYLQHAHHLEDQSKNKLPFFEILVILRCLNWITLLFTVVFNLLICCDRRHTPPAPFLHQGRIDDKEDLMHYPENDIRIPICSSWFSIAFDVTITILISYQIFYDMRNKYV